MKISEMLDTVPLLCYNSLVILERPTGGESHMCQKKKAFVENRDQYRGVFSFCSIGVLLAALTGCFAFIWYRFYSDFLLLPFYRRGNWVMILLYAVLVLLFGKAFGGLKVGYLKRSDSFYSQMLSMFCVNLVTYLQVSLISRHFARLLPFVILMGIDLIILLLWIFFCNKLYFQLYPPRRLVVVYGDRAAAELVLKMSQRVEKYMICACVDSHQEKSAIVETIANYEGVILCDVPGQLRNDLLKYCFSRQMRTYIVPKISDIIIRGGEEIRLFDTPLVLCRNSGLRLEQRFVKRLFDLAFSLILAVPVLLVSIGVCIAIKLDDGGPVLYRQKRLTYNGKPFYVYKFRSMVCNAEEHGPQLAKSEDDRITRVGKVLRKCRLDELPQLWNIFKGDMAVVGPRPERPELAEKYEEEMPEFAFRLRVKAGLTGYAQVIGLYDTTPYDKLKMDLMYIEKYSLLLDLQILLMTIKTALFPGESNEELHEQTHIPVQKHVAEPEAAASEEKKENKSS